MKPVIPKGVAVLLRERMVGNLGEEVESVAARETKERGSVGTAMLTDETWVVGFVDLQVCLLVVQNTGVEGAPGGIKRLGPGVALGHGQGQDLGAAGEGHIPARLEGVKDGLGRGRVGQVAGTRRQQAVLSKAPTANFVPPSRMTQSKERASTWFCPVSRDDDQGDRARTLRLQSAPKGLADDHGAGLAIGQDVEVVAVAGQDGGEAVAQGVCVGVLAEAAMVVARRERVAEAEDLERGLGARHGRARMRDPWRGCGDGDEGGADLVSTYSVPA